MGQNLDFSGEDMFAVEEKFFQSAGGGHGNLFHYLLGQVMISYLNTNTLIFFYNLVSSVLPISEGLEIIVQENTYSNSTGILGNSTQCKLLIIMLSSEIKVPAHKNYTDSIYLLHQDSVRGVINVFSF